MTKQVKHTTHEATAEDVRQTWRQWLQRHPQAAERIVAAHAEGAAAFDATFRSCWQAAMTGEDKLPAAIVWNRAIAKYNGSRP